MIRRYRRPPTPVAAGRRRWLAAIGWAVGIYLLAITMAACSVPPAPTQPSKMIKFLALRDSVGTDEVLQARIEVGSLAPDTRIIVRFDDGSIAGTVAPFGAQARRAGGVYFIPIPTKAITAGKVALHFELTSSGTAPTRAPNSDEIRSAELIVVPATPSSGRVD